MSPSAPGHKVRARRRRAARRAQRFAGLALIAVVALATLLLTAFGSGAERTAAQTIAPTPTRLLPAGPPTREIVATHGGLRLQLPVAQNRVTAIGFHPGEGLALEPVGTRGNEGFVGRLLRRVFGGSSSGSVWYQLDGEGGAPTAVLDVGAPSGTAVYAPVDGVVVAITDVVIDGGSMGVQIDIQPSAAPAAVVSVTRLGADPALTVGSTVSAAQTRIGTLLDFSAVEYQELSRYTRDAGNHVSVTVRPAAAS